MNQEEEVVRVTIYLPRQLHTQLKVVSALTVYENKKSVSDLVVDELIKAYPVKAVK